MHMHIARGNVQVRKGSAIQRMGDIMDTGMRR